MRCANPFMKDYKGRLTRLRSLTETERLNMTPFPCGWCLPCRINKARTWQHRIMLETKSHKNSSFVTLTYDDNKIPMTDHGDQNLLKDDLQRYLKRLRKKYGSNYIRYFAVGEYGDKTKRPHYHLCLFGLGKEDSENIESSWTENGEKIGHIHIGDVELESARYIAGYCIKKLTKKEDERLYGREPEFMLSSRKGGIGKSEVVRIAKVLKSNPYFDINTVLNSFKIGEKEYPLGGYLSNVLFNELGTPEDVRKEILNKYQNELFRKNNAKSDNYYHNIIDNSAQYRLKLEKKHKIFNKEKRL